MSKTFTMNKCIVGLFAILLSTSAHATKQWFTKVSIARVNTVANSGMQIMGSKGCNIQPGNGFYLTGAITDDPQHSDRMVSLLLTAQTTGKTVSFYVECGSGEITQMCIDNPEMNLPYC